MNRSQKVFLMAAATLLCCFCLFLLALVNVLYSLLGLAVLLVALLIVRKYKPEWFARPRKDNEMAMPSTADSNVKDKVQEEQRVYMVLAGQMDFGARSITVNKPNYTIGRMDDNDFILEGDRVSRHHMEIRYDPVEQVCYVTDMGSANGTYLNSMRMEPHRSYKLVEGDHVMLDGRDFTVQYAHF